MSQVTLWHEKNFYIVYNHQQLRRLYIT